MSSIYSLIPKLIGTGIGDYNAGQIYKDEKLELSYAFNYTIRDELMKIITRIRNSNNADDAYQKLKKIYILGPVYKEYNDIQIGFTGKRKFTRKYDYNGIRGNDIKPEIETEILRRELFEESGLYTHENSLMIKKKIV